LPLLSSVYHWNQQRILTPLCPDRYGTTKDLSAIK
jgi:hypothetical protein